MVGSRAPSLLCPHSNTEPALIFTILSSIQQPTSPQKPTKKRRAPREDLSGLTAEEKVERKKQRARVYSHFARKRNDAIMAELKKDVEEMRVSRWGG